MVPLSHFKHPIFIADPGNVINILDRFPFEEGLDNLKFVVPTSRDLNYNMYFAKC